MKSTNVLQKLLISKYNGRTFFIFSLIVISFLIIDLSLSKISDVVSNKTENSSLGTISFLIITTICTYAQYYFYVKLRGKYNESRFKPLETSLQDNIVGLINFILIVINIVIILEVVILANYNIVLLIVDVALSYGLVIFLFAIFSKKFLSWFRINKSLIILLYALSAILILFSTVVTLIYFEAKLIDKSLYIGETSPYKITEASIISANTSTTYTRANFSSPHIPVDEPENPGFWPKMIYLVRDLKDHSIDAYFTLIWLATALLLLHNVKRIGQIKYWLIVTIALLYYIFAILPIIDTLVHDESLAILLDTYSTPAIGLFASIGFWSVSRSIKVEHEVKDYMNIAAIGFFLFFLTGEASVHQTSFPPFGIANVSFFAISSYLLITGLTYSVISVAKDTELRKYIKNSTVNAAKLIGNIGSAEVEKDLDNRVMDLVRRNADILQENESIFPSMSEEEIEEQIKEVIGEIRKHNKKP